MRCVYCIVVFLFWIINSNAQIQTLHNTLAKGTLNISGGLHFQTISTFNVENTTNYSLGINYCFKHHYTVGLEINTVNLDQINQHYNWHSSNLLAGINLQRNDLLFKTKLGKFKIASIVSLAEGTVFSNDQLTQNVQTITSSFRATGYYTACALGLRFECIRRFFFELKQTGGFIAKTNVNLRTQQAEKLTLDKWFTDTQVKIGIFMFINTLDKCGTCPKW